MNKMIYVYSHWKGLNNPELMGVLHSQVSRGKEIFSFEYDNQWLKSSKIKSLDPSLQLFPGRQFVPEGQNNFGLFLDSSPDRWGRFLMQRREAQHARSEKRDKKVLMESDYLLGVYDEHRMGALRFKADPDGPFLDNNKNYAAPPWTSLREIEYASLHIENEDAVNQKDYAKWLRMLIAPGGSLGGARPKASVVDEYGHPWIAKFPSNHDGYDLGAWEIVAHELAIKAGINMAEAKIQKFNSHHHTFLTKRFDRVNNSQRVHFASAMTQLQYSDGDDASSGVSYLELAEFILQQGCSITTDLEQLWRRIIFSICISNTDDHLRNHGFILDKESGWRLSPAFDINPVPFGDGLKLNISEHDNSQELDLAREVADYFRVNKTKADEIIKHIIKTVKNWRHVASKYHLSPTEQEQMARAFRMVDCNI